jgi:hypothetical protein
LNIGDQVGLLPVPKFSVAVLAGVAVAGMNLFSRACAMMR